MTWLSEPSSLMVQPSISTASDRIVDFEPLAIAIRHRRRIVQNLVDDQLGCHDKTIIGTTRSAQVAVAKGCRRGAPVDPHVVVQSRIDQRHGGARRIRKNRTTVILDAIDLCPEVIDENDLVGSVGEKPVRAVGVVHRRAAIGERVGVVAQHHVAARRYQQRTTVVDDMAVESSSLMVQPSISDRGCRRIEDLEPFTAGVGDRCGVLHDLVDDHLRRGATQSLAPPGVPRSPSPKGVDEVHQLVPTLLSNAGSIKAIEAPVGSGKIGPPSYSTRSISTGSSSIKKD